MKKIINGIRYDTEKAEKVAEYWNGLPNNNFGYEQEWLYITKNGNYFVHGEGGPLSSYSIRYGNSTSGGQNIIPITKNEIPRWLEDRELYEKVEELFPETIKDA